MFVHTVLMIYRVAPRTVMTSIPWLPPIPPEHGAKTLLLVGLVTPVSIGFGSGHPLTVRSMPSYLAFAGIAAATVLFREAIRQSLLAQPAATRRYKLIALLEAIGLVALVGALMALENPRWALLLLFPIGGALEAWVTRDHRSNPLLKAGGGVIAIGLFVPLGMGLLKFTEPAMLLAGYGLFVGYYLLAVLRVGAAVEAVGSVPALALLVPIAAIGLVGVGYRTGGLGIGAAIVFGLSGLRSAQLQLRDLAPSLQRLGQAEAVLSLVFVLAGPVLLP